LNGLSEYGIGTIRHVGGTIFTLAGMISGNAYLNGLKSLMVSSSLGTNMYSEFSCRIFIYPGRGPLGHS
jgi:hypothetical protein